MTTQNPQATLLQLLTDLTTLTKELQSRVLLPDPFILSLEHDLTKYKEWRLQMGKQLASLPPAFAKDAKISYMCSRTTGVIHELVNEDDEGNCGVYGWRSPAQVFKALQGWFWDRE